MNRFEDSPELFGGGYGGGTYAEIKCEICGIVYNEGCGVDEKGELSDDNLSDESIPFTDFAGLTVCYCCFGKIEAAIWNRVGDLLPWIGRIIKNRKEAIEDKEMLLKDIIKNLGS